MAAQENAQTRELIVQNRELAAQENAQTRELAAQENAQIRELLSQHREMTARENAQTREMAARENAQTRELLSQVILQEVAALRERSDAQHAETMGAIQRLTDAFLSHSHDRDGTIRFRVPPPDQQPLRTDEGHEEQQNEHLG